MRGKSLAALLLCYCIWGMQPLYWNLLGKFDSMFVLCCRIVMCAAFTWIFLACSGRIRELLAAFRDGKLLRRLAAAALFLAFDWALFNWAVANGHVLDTALGYYMNPMVIFLVGITIFREKGSALEFAAVIVACTGVVLSWVSYGSFPIVAVLCALSWPAYATVKKAAKADPLVSMAVESTVLTPFALIASLVFFRGEGGLAGVQALDVPLILLSGIVTGLPIILYTVGVNGMPFKVVGILQYLSSTISFACGALFMGEEVTTGKLVMFGFIIAGLILFTAGSFRRRRPDTGAEESGK